MELLRLDKYEERIEEIQMLKQARGNLKRKLKPKRIKVESVTTGMYPKKRKKKKSKKKKRFVHPKRKERKRKKPRQYDTYMKSDLWENRKNSYWQKFPRKCAVCKTTNRIHLHHAFYDKKVFGFEKDEHLFPLCAIHHKQYHAEYGVKKDMIETTARFISENQIISKN